MAEADKDGHAAQIVGDLMATAAMSVSESARDAVAEFAERFCPDCLVGVDCASHYDCPNGPWSEGVEAVSASDLWHRLQALVRFTVAQYDRPRRHYRDQRP